MLTITVDLNQTFPASTANLGRVMISMLELIMADLLLNP